MAQALLSDLCNGAFPPFETDISWSGFATNFWRRPSIDSLLFLEMYLGVKVGPIGFLFLLLALAAALPHAVALTTVEIATLEMLQLAFPQLSALPEHFATLNTFHYGRRWDGPPSDMPICASDGWTWYGIYCRGGSIVGVRMYALLFWKLPIQRRVYVLRLTIPHLHAEIATGAKRPLHSSLRLFFPR